jgi:cysteine desulfurase
MNEGLIYLDNNSTTPVDPQVLETMLPYFTNHFGNAASRSHAFGWIADEAVKNARKTLATFIGAEESEIIFTSGATESINLGIKGVAEAYHSKGKHIITIATEHKAVLDTCAHLEKQGHEITILPVQDDGMLDLQLLEKSIRPDTILVCAMLANNETGVIHPIDRIAAIVHEKNSLLFCDATQAGGKLRVDLYDLKADLLCLSAHKMYGPKGVGLLYVKRKNPRVTLIGQQDGGGHERGLRSGTLNVPGIVGFAKAAELCQIELMEISGTISILRTRLEQALCDMGASINGNIKHRLPNTTNLNFPNRKADELMKALPKIAMATGSACSSALPEPSHVLTAMGLNQKEAYSSIRFSLGRFTTGEEIETTILEFQRVLR